MQTKRTMDQDESEKQDTTIPCVLPAIDNTVIADYDKLILQEEKQVMTEESKVEIAEEDVHTNQPEVDKDANKNSQDRIFVLKNQLGDIVSNLDCLD